MALQDGLNGISATLLAALTTVLLVATAPDIGLTWDEPAYIVASESYVTWLGELITQPRHALSAEEISYHWDLNCEHPPLDKVWSGLVWSVARFAFDDLTAHRLGNILLAGALVALLYLTVAQTCGQIAGLGAAGALITMPRFFFHAHLAALDVPAAFAVFAVVFAFWRTKDRSGIKWDVWLGLVWGLAMATKINAILVPPTLFLWLLIFQRRRNVHALSSIFDRTCGLYLIRRLALMVLVGVPLSLAVWPWLYREFLPRLAYYVLFVTVDHWEIGQWYLGRLYMPPPWHFPFVITVAVVPLTLTISCVIGIVRTAREKRSRALGWLFVFCAVMPMLVLAIGQTKVYDNDRLFMPSFPYLAALAGLGFDWVIQGLQKWAKGSIKPAMVKSLTTVVAGIVFVPHVVLAWGLYPHLLSYYSEAIGGLRGAARLGLETTYWCETYAQALPYLNAHAQPGDIVWVQGWSHDVMIYYQLHGKLRRDLRIALLPYTTSVFEREGTRGHPASIQEADYVVLQHRQTGFTDEVRRWLRGRKPVYRLSHRGIPLIEIYAR